MNVRSIEDWKKLIPSINSCILEEYLNFCYLQRPVETNVHRHHVFPRSFSKHFKIEEAQETVSLVIEEHLHAHELLYAMLPEDILKAKAAGAVYRVRTGLKQPLIGVENPNFEKGFLWWWKHQYSQKEYEEKLAEFKSICSKNFSGEGNPMFGAESANKGKGYYYWWVQKYGEEKAKKLEKNYRKRQAESQKKYYETHVGTFTGKKHTEDTKRKLSEIAKRRTKNGHSTAVYCVETGEEWANIRQLAHLLCINESTLYSALAKGEYIRNEKHYRKRDNISKD